MPSQEVSTDAGLQQFLDDLTQCNLPPRQHQWFHIDVAAMFSSTPIHAHEVDQDNGKPPSFSQRFPRVALSPTTHSPSLSPTIDSLLR